MLLTLKQPSNYGFKSFQDYSPPTPPSTSRFSPALISMGPSYPPPLPETRKLSTELPMSTSHRGLPPPAAMNLPQSSSAPPSLSQAPSLSQSMGPLPAPPQQWQGAEESMRNWLHAKSEEEKRKQEEEKTRQESLRLEQRKIEQDMLRTSLTGGIPPYMIPMVFAGMGGGNLPNASLEWAQNYMAQTHQLQQQQSQSQPQNPAPAQPPSPVLRREDRQISHPYPPPQHPAPAPLPSTPITASGSQQGPISIFVPSYSMSPVSRARAQLPGPSALTRTTHSSQLPRLNTGEIQILQPPQAAPPTQAVPGQSQHSLQSQASQQPEQESQQSPGIYFHHWQPPTTSSNQPTTPLEPSPKKRKAQGPQQAAPAPTSQPQYHSPPFSHAGSSVSGPSGTPARGRGHSRQRSDRGSLEYGRPRGRHQQHESEGNISSAVSPDDRQQGYGTPSGDGPISGRRNTIQLTRDDRHDPRQHYQQHQQHYSEIMQQQHSTGPDMRRRDVDRGVVVERSPDREMPAHLHSSSKRDERD